MAAGHSLKLGGFKEDNTCRALNRYFGEFWYDVARAAKCEPKKCPIAKVRKFFYNSLHIQQNSFSCYCFREFTI